MPFVFSSLAHPKEASPGVLYYSTYYQNPASVRQWLSTDSEKKKKKSVSLIESTKYTFQQGAALFGMFNKRRNPLNLLCTLRWNPLKGTQPQAWWVPLMLS